MSKPEKVLTWEDVRHNAKIIAQIICQSAPCPYKVWGIPRGGIHAAHLVVSGLLQLGRSAELMEHPAKANLWVDDIIDTGKTVERLRVEHKKAAPCFFLVEKKKDDPHWYSFPWERMQSETGPDENIIRSLQYIGEDPNREGLLETPSRVVKSWNTLYGGYYTDPTTLLKVFSDGACDEMVVLKDIEFYSTCEHHMLPFFGKAHIGYLPNKKIVGVSKLARLLEVFARRLQIQERIGQQVTETIMQVLKPKGCGCLLEAQHFCMTSRGVQKQNSVMVTSSLRGAFREDADLRSEFYRMIGK